MADDAAPGAAPAAASTPVAAVAVAYAAFAVAAVTGLVNAAVLFLAPLVGLFGIVGVVIAYVVRDRASGTWVESHVRWLTRTFWWSLIWTLIGVVVFATLGLILIGIPIAIAIWFLAAIWVFYRVARGFLRFQDRQPTPS